MVEDDPSELSPDDGRRDSADSQLVIDTADSLSRTFSVLSDEETRNIIYVLLRHDETTISLSKLTRSVSALVDAENRPRLRNRMIYTHLPRLGIVGIVDYDLTADPHVWLSTNADIVDKDLLYDLVERTYRYERN
jgi:hypothetical protein